MIRVLMTADSVGGVWTYALDLTDRLRPLGVEVHLALMGPAPSRQQRRQLAASAVIDVVEIPAALEWMDDPWHDVEAAGRQLVALAEEVDADVVHLNGFVHAALLWERPVVVVAHSDVMSWWYHVRGGAAPACWNEYRARVARGLHAASAIVVLTESGLEDLRRAYGVEKAHCIPNGRRREWVRKRPKEPLVLGAGRLWDEAKDLRALVAAARDLEWQVAVAGALDPNPVEPAPGGASLGDECSRRVDANVTLLDRLAFEDLAAWMARAEVFAAPARYEPFGLAVLEAALSGCALVLGDIDTFRDLWEDDALYVEPGDAAALHDALSALCGDIARCRQLGERARARAQRYPAERMAEAYARLYHGLQGAGRADLGVAAEQGH